MSLQRKVSVILAALGVICVADAAWIHIKAYAAQVLIESAWNRTQRGDSDARPWPWADTTPVARLTLLEPDPPSITLPVSHVRPRGESLIVLEGANGRNLAFGPTHDASSVMPGDLGNSVIAAHRDTHFKLLENVKIGDRLRVERIDKRVADFAITDIQIVDSRKTRIALGADEPRLTLVTCYPFNAIQPGGPLRFVVTATEFTGKN